MNKKVPLGATLALIIITIALTVSVTMVIAMRQFNSTMSDVGQRQVMFEYITDIDKTVRQHYACLLYTSQPHSEYILFVEGEDEQAQRYAALLAVSLSSIKQYYDEKYDRGNFVKNVILDNILPGDIYLCLLYTSRCV